MERIKNYHIFDGVMHATVLNVVKAGCSTFLEIHFCVTISLVSNHEIPCKFRGM